MMEQEQVGSGKTRPVDKPTLSEMGLVTESTDLACRYCGILPDQDWPRPSYQQLKACVASLRSDLDWAIGLLRQVSSTPPVWCEGVGEFLDAIDAEEGTDG